MPASNLHGGDGRSRVVNRSRPVRVLYSFPHKLGADRICTTAWYQVDGLVKAGAEVVVCPSAVSRPVAPGVDVRPTLARGRWRIPYAVLGRMRAFALHDWVVARRLTGMVGQVDIVHAWPLGCLRTLRVAASLGIRAVLERPNAHTRFAYDVVRRECGKLGVDLPHGHEHAYDETILAHEEAEYRLATRLLCPSDFVAKTFLDEGFAAARLARHQYGFDAAFYRADPDAHDSRPGLTLLFVGGCAPRKGLHYALEAWTRSAACRQGRFLIAGEFVPGYAERLAPMLSHPSVEVLGHRSDVAQLMRSSDLLVLPSIEEGSALVTFEARGSGCVLLVSEAAGAMCRHLDDALVHRVGDVATLADHIDSLHVDRPLLASLRRRSLAGAAALTWDAAGVRLLQVYRETLASSSDRPATALRTAIGSPAVASTAAGSSAAPALEMPKMQ